jgi:MFS family permease
MGAAYVLHAKGHAPHGEGGLMDRYMRLITWTVNTEKVDAYKTRLAPVAARPWYGWVEFVFLLLMISAAVGGWWLVEEYGGALPSLMLIQLVAAMAAFLLARAVTGLLAGWLSDDFAAWRYHLRGRIRARWRDHRFWMFLLGIGALGLTAALFVLLPSQFQPVTDEDTTQVTVEMIPGTTIQQT